MSYSFIAPHRMALLFAFLLASTLCAQSAASPEKKAASKVFKVDDLMEIRSYEPADKKDRRRSLRHFGINPHVLVTIAIERDEQGKIAKLSEITDTLKALDSYAREASLAGVDFTLGYFPFSDDLLGTPSIIKSASLKYCGTALLRQFADGQLEKSPLFERLEKAAGTAGNLSWHWMSEMGGIAESGVGLDHASLAKRLADQKVVWDAYSDDERSAYRALSLLDFEGLEDITVKIDKAEAGSGKSLSYRVTPVYMALQEDLIERHKDDLPRKIAGLEEKARLFDKTTLEDSIKDEIKALSKSKEFKEENKAYEAYLKVRELFDLTRSRVKDPERLSYEHWYGEQIHTNEEIAKPAETFLKKYGESRYAKEVKVMQDKAAELAQEARDGLEAVKKVGNPNKK